MNFGAVAVLPETRSFAREYAAPEDGRAPRLRSGLRERRGTRQRDAHFFEILAGGVAQVEQDYD